MQSGRFGCWVPLVYTAKFSWPVGGHCITKFSFFNSFYKNTVDEEEVEKLSRPTSDWWNPNGEFAALHSMNKLRISFIKKSLDHRHTQNISPSKPLGGFRILDVGCGGGILSEVRHI